MWLFALFIAVPIVEIALFIEVGGWIGLWPTLAIVIATALAGSFLLRSQGIQTVARLRASVGSGENPMNPIAHGALILVAAVLLLTPGFFTDTVGLLLLVPPLRSRLIRAGASRLASRVFVATPGPGGMRTEDDIIDAEYSSVAETDRSEPRSSSGWTRNGQ